MIQQGADHLHDMKMTLAAAVALAATCAHADAAVWHVAEWQGAPALFRGDRPEPPVLFWQWELEREDVTALSQAGVGLYSLFGSFPNYAHPYWTASNTLDTAYAEAKMDDLFRWAPQAAVLPRLFACAPDWWIAAHPEEQVRFSRPVAYNRACPPRESFASEAWRTDVAPFFRGLVRRLYGKYGDRMLGVHVANGPWGEGFSWDAYFQLRARKPGEEIPVSDFSAPMQRRFKAWLERTYGGTAPESPVPTYAERETYARGGWRDPRDPVQRRAIDYFRCHHETVADAIDGSCALVKEATDGRLPTLCFYGYTHDTVMGVETQHRLPLRLYRSPNVDMFSAPHTYNRRGLGDDGQHRQYLASAALHGKFFIDEADERTYLSRSSGRADKNRLANTLDESLQFLYREFGQAVTHAIGLWYMDLTRGNFRHPAFVEAVGRMRKWSAEALKRDRRSVSEVAVLSKPESAFYRGYHTTLTNNLEQATYLEVPRALYRAGAPFDWYLLDDVEAVAAKDYKVVVLMDCEYMTARERAAVERLRGKNRTLVFFHAPAYASDDDLSLARTEALTGFSLTEEDGLFPLRAVYPDGARWGSDWEQLGLVLPRDGTPLATGAGALDGRTVLAEKRFSDWTTVFAAVPGLTPEALRRLYRAAGVHVWCDRDAVLSANASWVMLHTRESGPHEIVLPHRAKRVVEITSEKTLGTDTDRVIVSPSAYKTLVLMFGENQVKLTGVR